VKRLLYGLEGSRLRRLERRLGRYAAAVTFTSEHEVELYRGFCPDVEAHDVANGVDLEFFQSNGLAPSEQPSCVFVGVLNYPPNVDAVTWFCNHVWPGVLRRIPDARFTIVGANPSSSVLRLVDRPGVMLAANVPDVRPFLASSTVAVAPLRISRGVQNKVLEALAMRKAVVATPGALTGLKLRTGEDALAATSSEEWIDTLVSLFSNRERCHRLGVAGRCYVEEHHNWDRCLDKFGRLSDSVTRNGCGSHSEDDVRRSGSANRFQRR
jgi:sugar transferase (PEP-CTERM/EpsH1 system associated)